MTTADDTRARRATWIGASTVLNWGALSLFTQVAGPIPPFQLTALCFLLVFLCAVLGFHLRGRSLKPALRQPVGGWVLGVGGLFGFHFFYFIAQQNAPAANAGLITYLWPLLIVLFGALLPGERLRPHHLTGALAGFAGAALLIGLDGLRLEGTYAPGYAAALAAALIWSGYSVLSRRYAAVPSTAVAWNCLATAVLALVCHLFWERWFWPSGSQWLGVLALGLGPVGSAFFTWDVGVKHGHLRLLGLLAYFTPLLSTLLLIGAGFASPTPALLLATALIVGGALIGSGRLVPRP